MIGSELLSVKVAVLRRGGVAAPLEAELCRQPRHEIDSRIDADARGVEILFVERELTSDEIKEVAPTTGEDPASVQSQGSGGSSEEKIWSAVGLLLPNRSLLSERDTPSCHHG